MAGASPAMTSYVLSRENQHDRVFDLARVGRPCRNRSVGGISLSASSTAGASVKDLPILKLEWLIAALFAH
jgi:hypothetical protein